MSTLINDDIPALLELYDSESIKEAALHQPDVPHLLADLLKREQYEAAIAFLSHALQVPFALAWGYFCLVHAHIQWNEKESELIQCAQRWLQKPDEKHRRLHESSLEQTGVSSPAGWLSQAIFWSGGSITPEGSPEVSPQPFLLGHALSGAIQLAALAESGQHSQVLYPLFIKTGIRVVEGLSKEKLLSIRAESNL